MKCFVCFFVVCLFCLRYATTSASATPKGGPVEITPTTQVTCHPQASSYFLFSLPRTFVKHPASGPYPPCPPVLSSCPVHITYRVPGLCPPCFPVLHIYSNPTERNPSTHIKPHIQTMLIHYFNKQTTKTTMYHYLVSTPVSSVRTCSSAPHLHQ